MIEIQDGKSRYWTNINNTAIRASVYYATQRGGRFAGIPGDVNGDGFISILDSVRIKNHLLEVKLLEGDEIVRADTDGDDRVTMADLVYVNNHISPAVFDDNAVFIGDTSLLASVLTVVNVTSETVLLTWTGPGESPIKAGGVIFGKAVIDGVFIGFIRRVISFEVFGNIIMVQTAQASLVDAIVYGQFTGKTFFEDAEFHRDLTGLSLYPNPLVQNPNPGLTATVTAGSLDFAPVVDYHFSIENSRLQYFKVGVGGELNLNMDLRALLDGAGVWNGEFTLLEVEKPFAVGWVVGCLKGRLKAKSDVAGAAGDEVRTNVNMSIPIKFQNEYIEKEWLFSSLDKAAQVSHDPVKTTLTDGNVTVAVVISPQLDVFFYDAAGPKMDMEPFMFYESSAGFSPLKHDTVLTAGLDLAGQVDLGILDPSVEISFLGPRTIWGPELLWDGHVITIDVNPDSAEWLLTGPEEFGSVQGTGDLTGALAIVNAPSGTYRLRCFDVPQYYSPGTITKSLGVYGGTLAFKPQYFLQGSEDWVETTVMLPGDVPLPLVLAPAGSFQMGSAAEEKASRTGEMPIHTVDIATAFFMGKYEVTQAQWLALMGKWPEGHAPDPDYDGGYGVGDNYPMYNVTWNQITQPGGFLDKLNQHVAATGQGSATFRLPSEAEWEYACRAGTQTRFFFGDSLSVEDYAVDGRAGTLPGNRSNYMWYWYNSQDNNNGTYGAKEVGTKLPNLFGLYDMHGNVYEWCQDLYHYGYSEAPADGSAWNAAGDGPYRVLRGGTWLFTAEFCRSAYRNLGSPDDGGFHIGFRLMRTVN